MNDSELRQQINIVLRELANKCLIYRHLAASDTASCARAAAYEDTLQLLLDVLARDVASRNVKVHA